MKPLVYVIFLALCAGGVAFNVAARRRGWRPAGVGWANALLALALLTFMGVVSQPRVLLDDFRQAYYPAGTRALNHPEDLYKEDLGFVNLPLLALPFAPLAALDYVTACAVFTAAGLAAVAAAWALLVRLAALGGWRRLALAGLFLACGPLYYSLREGNATHFVLLLLALAVGCLETRREAALGALLAMAALVKPPLLLLPAYFALRRRWRVVAGAGGVLLLTGAASLLVYGVEVHRVWLARCVGPYATRPMTAYNVQSLAGVLARLLTDGDEGLGWRPVKLTGPGAVVYRILLAVLAGGPLLACLRRRGEDREGVERLELCMALCLALLTSTVSWTHYYLLLLVPGALLLGNRLPVPATPRWVAALLLAFLLTSFPVVANSSRVWLARLLVSHCWAGGVLFLALLTSARWRAGANRPALHIANPADKPAHLPPWQRRRRAA